MKETFSKKDWKLGQKYLFMASADSGVKQLNIETHQEVCHYNGFKKGYIIATALTNYGKY